MAAAACEKVLPSDVVARPPSRRTRLRSLLESLPFSLLVLGLVITGVLVDNLAIEGCLLAFFICECFTRMYAMGPALFMTDAFCAIDALTTAIDLFSFIAQSPAAGFAAAGRLVRMLKLLPNLSFLQRFVAAPPPKGSSAPPGTVFSLFASPAFDLNEDGELTFVELKNALTSKLHVMVSSHLLHKVFNDIYCSRMSELAGLFDDNLFPAGFLETEERTIRLSELEDFVRQVQPSTAHERRWRVVKVVLFSLNCWSIFGYFCANAIVVSGKPSVGLYTPSPDGLGGILDVLACVLWCLGGIGYLRLHWQNLQTEFDAFEMVELTLVDHFRKTLALTPSQSPTKEKGRDEKRKSKRSSDAELLDLQQQQQQQQHLSIDDVRMLLTKKNVPISDSALLVWFKRVDTSGDKLISRREIRQYVSAWRPSNSRKRTVAVFSRFSDFTGVCLLLFLAAAILYLGNALLWKHSVSASTKFELTTCATYMWFFGILGFIQIGTQSVSNDFEALENARRSLAIALTADSSAAATLFRADDFNSASAWVRRLLENDSYTSQSQSQASQALQMGVGEEELDRWCTAIQNDCYLEILPYFVALLKHDKQALMERTGVPLLVLYRLVEALAWEETKPWRAKEASAEELQATLIAHHVLISSTNVSKIYREIDTDGSNSVSMAEFEQFRRAKRRTKSEKRAHVLSARLSDPGFYLQLCSLAACLFYLGPGHFWGADAVSEGSDGATTRFGGPFGLSAAGSYHIGAYLFLAGTLESVRQAVRTVVAEIDLQEQATLDFRRAIESASDAYDAQLERQAEKLGKGKGKGKGKGMGDGSGHGRESTGAAGPAAKELGRAATAAQLLLPASSSASSSSASGVATIRASAAMSASTKPKPSLKMAMSMRHLLGSNNSQSQPQPKPKRPRPHARGGGHEALRHLRSKVL